MRIAYAMRVDALDKPGGDLVQVREYIAGGRGDYTAGKILYSGTLITDPSEPLVGYDLIHLTNLDRPVETYAFYRAAKAAGKKVVFSTIHHSYEEISKYERTGRFGLFRFVSGLLSFQALEVLRTVIRGRNYPNLFPMLWRILKVGIAKAQLEMLHGSDEILVLSWKEHADILSDCPGSNDCTYARLSNGLPPFPALPVSAGKVSRDIDVCVVGRIEARKNQLRILDCFEKLGLSGVFVGAENPNHATYCESFRRSIAKSRSSYAGVLSREDTLLVMRRAKVHVSASWFEVLSLVDLEAYAAGCQIVSSRCGGTRDVLGEEAVYVDPSDFEDIQKGISFQLGQFELKNQVATSDARLTLESWEDIAHQLASIYQRYGPKL